MSAITPTTQEVRASYRNSNSTLGGIPYKGPYESPADLHDEFDRWLTAHDEKVRADTLEAAAASSGRLGHVLFRSVPGGGCELWDGEIYPTRYEAACNVPARVPNPQYAHNVQIGLLTEASAEAHPTPENRLYPADISPAPLPGQEASNGS